MRDSCDLGKLTINTFKLIENVNLYIRQHTYVVCFVYIFIFKTNDNGNEHWEEFDMSCGTTEAKNMTTVFS